MSSDRGARAQRGRRAPGVAAIRRSAIGLTIAVTIAGCGSSSNPDTAGSASTSSASAAVTSDPAAATATEVPASSTGPAIAPATTAAPVVTSPTSEPPATSPPATSPPATEPPPTSPPATEPSTTEPATTEPATTEPATTAAPTTTAAPLVVNGVTLATCIASENFQVGVRSPRPEVALYQYTLDALGYEPGTIDGYFGQNTMNAAAEEILDHSPDSGVELFLDDGAVSFRAFERLHLAC